MKEFFSPPPQKKFFNPPQASLQRFLTPLTSRPAPTAGLEITNSLQIICFIFAMSDIEVLPPNLLDLSILPPIYQIALELEAEEYMFATCG